MNGKMRFFLECTVDGDPVFVTLLADSIEDAENQVIHMHRGKTVSIKELREEKKITWKR